MGGYTRFHSNTFQWDKIRHLDAMSELLWMGLYMSAPAKALMPGLWRGSIISMADEICKPVDATAIALDVLIEHDLVEFDAKNRVARLTELPDAGDWPSSPNILESWFSRFLDITECGVRNAHVPTLRWLLDRGASLSSTNKKAGKGGRPSEAHEEVWARTFGTISVPAVRRRGVRRMADNNDTSTTVQPSLFASREAPNPEADGIQTASDVPRSVDKSSTGISSSASSQPIENSDLGIPSGSHLDGIQMGSEKEKEKESFSSSPDPEGQGAGYGARPALALVPPPGPFTVPELTAVFEGPRWPRCLPDATSAALARAIGSLPGRDGPATLALLRAYRAVGALGGISPEQFTHPGGLAAAIQEASAWQRDSDAKAAALRDVMKQAGMT